MLNYTRFEDLAHEVEPPPDGIISRTLYNDDRLKAVIFGFGKGQELSDHAAASPAVMHFLKGEGRITLGDEITEAAGGTWVHMAAGLRHAIHAKTPLIMLLLILK